MLLPAGSLMSLLGFFAGIIINSLTEVRCKGSSGGKKRVRNVLQRGVRPTVADLWRTCGGSVAAPVAAPVEAPWVVLVAPVAAPWVVLVRALGSCGGSFGWFGFGPSKPNFLTNVSQFLHISTPDTSILTEYLSYFACFRCFVASL